MKHIALPASLVVAASGIQSVEFHRQRMISIAAELDQMRRDPRVTTAQIDEHTRLLVHHRAQADNIEAQLKDLEP